MRSMTSSPTRPPRLYFFHSNLKRKHLSPDKFPNIFIHPNNCAYFHFELLVDQSLRNAIDASQPVNRAMAVVANPYKKL